MNDSKSIYAVIRTENLSAALTAFRSRFNADPVGVVVNAAVIEKADTAQALAAALVGAGLDIPVTASGGCLLGELWLQRPTVDTEAGAVALRQLALALEGER